MDATLDCPLIPARSNLRPFFNQQNAKEYQQKSLEAKKAKKLAEQAAELARKQFPVNYDRIARLDSQLTDLEKKMKGEDDADVIAKLSAAHGKLFSAWQVLTSTPNPGSRKTSSRRPSSDSLNIQPVEPISPPQEPVIQPQSVTGDWASTLF